jgi:3-deoxy-D-manno-octulosonic-acid transferase
MFLYSIAIRLYVFIIYLVAPFHAKARKTIAGRRGFFQVNPPSQTPSYIWFHCASLGEFEQGRPLLEKIKKEFPQKKILLSFFSPSGYEVRKNYEHADRVIYLPFDSASHARKFFESFKIDLVVFVKYDVWPFYLREILQRKIPVFLTSAVFRPNLFYFKWYGRFFKNMLQHINRIFVQDAESEKLGSLHGLKNIEIAGDARIDRVLTIKNNPAPMEEVKKFIGGKNCIVFGSIYKSDLEIIAAVEKNMGPNDRLVIAPHQVSDQEMKVLQQRYPQALLYRDLANAADQKILVVDHVGSLNQLYQFATMAYIGGGFERGIHNILEPAVFNIPVFIGPEFSKFPEAKSLLVENLVFSASHPDRIAQLMLNQMNQVDRNDFRQRSENWFLRHSGATDLILSKLKLFF